MKILVTGFMPFGGESRNPSAEAVRLLPERIDGRELTRLVLPTSYRRAPELLSDAIAESRPDAVICVGQAGGRSGLSLEYAALNVADAAIPDEDGELRRGSPLAPGGQEAFFTSLPVYDYANALRAQGCACAVSYSAGTYVCNALYYRLLSLTRRGLFVHIPYDELQAASKPAGTPFLPLASSAAALRALIKLL